MRGAFLIAVREIAERRAMIFAALVAGIIPFAAPLFPGVRAGQGAEARDGLALIFGVAFGAGMALLLGSTIVGRDLSEGRLGFDFARPLRGGSIWAGRLIGAVALTFLVLAVVALPTTLAGGGLLSKSIPEILKTWTLAAAAVLVLVPLAHVTSIAFRSRSVWLVVDLVGLLLVTLIGALAGRRLADGFAVRDLTMALAVLAAIAFPALWSATFAQVVAGRTDLRRGHRIQSTVLWGSLLGAVLCFDLYSRFVVHAGPEDLVSASALAAPRGSWLLVAGSARGRGDFTPAFLMDVQTGRSWRLGGADPWVDSPVVFSGDGKHAVWLKPGGLKDPRHDVLRMDLTRPEDGFHETQLSFPSPFVQVALSEDGERLAAIEGPSIAVYHTTDGALLASARYEELPDSGGRGWSPRPALFFTDPDHVRAILPRSRVRILELDVPAKRIAKIGEAPEGIELGWMTRDANGRRLLLRDGHGPSDSSVLLDGRTGAVLATFPAEPDVKRNTFRFLEDGRLLFVERRAGSSVVRSITAEGDERQYPIDAKGVVVIGGEISPGSLVLAERPEDASAPAVPGSGRLLVLDLAGGDVREAASRGLTPWLTLRWVHDGGPFAAGSLATRLFLSGGAVVLLDPAMGEERLLVGRK